MPPRPLVSCPWCDRKACCVLNRCHDDAEEYQCLACGMCHTRKEDQPEYAFAFFPPDIDRALQAGEDSGLKALDL